MLLYVYNIIIVVGYTSVANIRPWLISTTQELGLYRA